MALPTEVVVALVAFGGMVVGFLGTVFGAVLTNRSVSAKTRNEHALGVIAEDRQWVDLQIRTMQESVASMKSEIASNRAHYEGVIDKLHQEHITELERQEKHCQDRLDFLTRQVMTLTAQLRAYTTDLRKSGVHISPQTLEVEGRE